MKKVMLGLALALVAAGAWAQTTWVSITPGMIYVPGFQASVGSSVGGVADLYGLDEDNYLDVTGWSGVDYEKYYFFLGGKAAVNGSGFQGGFAAKAFGGHLGMYFNGELADGLGENYDNDPSDTNAKYSQSMWNTAFALLYASEAIGGVRFDLVIKDMFLWTGEADKAATVLPTLPTQLANWSAIPATWATAALGAVPDLSAARKASVAMGDLITTLQWGKDLGFITPKIMVGFKWPEYGVVEDTDPAAGQDVSKSEMWTDAALAVKLEAEFAAIPVAIDNTFVMNFGTTVKGDPAFTAKNYEVKSTGWIYDNLNVYYTATADVDEKLQIKLRPQLSAFLASRENKTTIDYENITAGSKEMNTAPEFYLGFSPIVELAAKYQVSEKFALYGGVKAIILTVSSYSTSTYKPNDTAAETKDKSSQYTISPLTYGNMDTSTELKLGASFAFSPAFSLNASLSSGVLQVGVPGANYTAVTPVTSWLTAGSLVLNFKPGAK